jgi:hypothetical protein
MPNINQQQLQVCQITNQIVPGEGPKAVAMFLDFSAHPTYTLDATLLQDLGYLSLAQVVYIDMSNAASGTTLSMVMQGSNQNVTVEGGSQGYYPILAPNKLGCTITSNADVIVPIYLINEPIPGCNWPPSTGGGGSGIDQLTGDVTAGPGSGSQVATLVSPTPISRSMRRAALQRRPMAPRRA